jgi:hypothetical protein
VRVIRPGGEMKIMLYNRHSIYSYRRWLQTALGRGRPWKSLRWVLANHVESAGTKGYTKNEIALILSPLGLTDVRIETFLTGVDHFIYHRFPFRLCNRPLAALVALTGNHFGWSHCICARKQA